MRAKLSLRLTAFTARTCLRNLGIKTVHEKDAAD